MPVRIVQSNQNARLKELRRSLSNPGREGLAAIEGPILIAEALRAGMRIHCVLAAQETEGLLAALRLPQQSEILLFPRTILEPVLTTETPQPIAALIEVPRWTWDQLLTGCPSRGRDAVSHSAANRTPLVLILAGLQDPGNLGTVLRSAEAFGATGILSLVGTVSEWNPKALRASAGSVFRVPIVRAVPEALAQLRSAGIRILTTTARQAEPVTAVDLTGPTAIIIGNEGNGVPRELAGQTDAAVTIPCPGPVESLNAAVAASVLLYEAARQRGLARPGSSGRESLRPGLRGKQ
jgi:TrmH family RNA methyltransferase